ncbi:cupin domain-containing protein [Blastopirellula marina]|uniref:Cupin region protein n=1 Tax=Blastopirellula marina DSM 3645 TaxID=314230 RepID=A3ZRB5_9BACT|nr:cupin domain-containing protein [Blastopirellula marina]EAQ80684.1 Cupin region protein [Blastopirellula marina DSM 3645]
MKRLVMIAAALLTCTAAWRITAHDPAHGPDVKPVMAQNIAEKIDGVVTRATMAEVTWQGGDFSEPHRHPGPTFVYVLAGEIETQVGDGPLLRLKAGDTLYEPSQALHRVTRNVHPDKPAKILALHLHPVDAKELVIPEPIQE